MTDLVNLIPKHRREARRRRAHVRAWTSICGGFALVVATAGLWVGLMPDGGALDLRGTLVRIADSTEQTRSTIAELETDLHRAEARLRAAGSIGSQPDWSILLALLADELKEQIVLDDLELRARGDGGESPAAAGGCQLVLGGLGRDQAAVTRFVLRLEAHDSLFDKVALITTRREPFFDGYAIGFRAHCELSLAAPEGETPDADLPTR